MFFWSISFDTKHRPLVVCGLLSFVICILLVALRADSVFVCSWLYLLIPFTAARSSILWLLLRYLFHSLRTVMFAMVWSVACMGVADILIALRADAYLSTSLFVLVLPYLGIPLLAGLLLVPSPLRSYLLASPKHHESK